MEQLKKWTEEFMLIKNKYDGGKQYRWSVAYADLGKLERDIVEKRQTMSVCSDVWIRELAGCLLESVWNEKCRICRVVLAKGEKDEF